MQVRRVPEIEPRCERLSAADRRGIGRRDSFMSRSTWKRAFTPLLIVMVCTLAVPVKASATGISMDSIFHSASKVWISAMDWLYGLWPAPATSSVPRGNPKFGAGHSSDGRSAAKPAVKAPF